MEIIGSGRARSISYNISGLMPPTIYISSSYQQHRSDGQALGYFVGYLLR